MQIKIKIAKPSKADFVWYTEEELFTKYNTVIFKGRVKEIENIIIDFNGQKEDRAIAKIQVKHTYRGELVQGQSNTLF